VIRGRLGAPTAVWKRRRFSRTFSRVSQSVKPRLRTFSTFSGAAAERPTSGETPPGRVEKAWISQGSLEKAGIWRSLRSCESRVVQEAVDNEALLRVEPLGEEDFVVGMKV